MTRAGKVLLFRCIAVGVPVAAGIALSLWLPRGDDSGVIYLQEPGHEKTGHRYLYDSEFGWRNIPGWRATTYDRPLVINSKGLRDREYAYEKPAQTRRILVLGDSYAWGYGVKGEETFAKVLEEQLARRDPDNWEVLNAGVSGWGTDQEYLYLMREGFKFSPDIVVVALFLLNDPENNVYSRQYGLDKPLFLNESLELVNVPVPKPGAGAVLQKSATDPIVLTVSILAGMAEACAEQDCRLVVMKFGCFLFPDRPRTRERNGAFSTEYSRRLKGAFLDLDAEFEASGFDAVHLLTGNRDGHWNAFGHLQTGQILYRFLANHGLLE